MRTYLAQAFQFGELSDKAKEAVIHRFQCLHGYHFADDAMESIKTVAEHFGGKIKDYTIDWFNSSYSSMSFEMPETERESIGEELALLGSFDAETLKGDGDCKLTGCCADEDVLDGFRQAFTAGESDLEKLMQAGFKTWLKAAQDDCSDFYSLEQFAEHCEANGYEFEASGAFLGHSAND